MWEFSSFLTVQREQRSRGISMMIVAVWMCVFLAAARADTETLYRKVGDEVVLKPGVASGTAITSLLWKVGSDIAMEWDGAGIDGYRHFKERGRLNTTSGEMTIIGLTLGDSGVYTPEINNNKVPSTPTHLQVIAPVPTPTINKICDDEMKNCTLTCDGATADAEPLTYNWKLGDKVLTESPKERHITKEDSSDIKEFICELENPVSQKSSQPVPNPFTSATDDQSLLPGNMKISAGLTVFISLLTVVILLAVVHRLKAGMCFYQKDSMPWEADFWSKSEGQRREATGSNGTTAGGEKEPREEETPMT